MLMIREISLWDSKETDTAEAIRYSSFDPGDLVKIEILRGLVEKGIGKYYVLEEEGETLGISFCLIYDKVIYVLYLAIKEERRGQGLGSKAMELLKERYEKYPLLLDMESVREEGIQDLNERLRRREFYERLGFQDTGYYLKDNGGMYDLFSTNGILYETEFMDAMEKCDFVKYHPEIHKADA